MALTLSVTANSQCLPDFEATESNITVPCGESLPEFDDCVATSDCCDGPVAISSFVSETGDVVTDCTLGTSFGPGPDWAIWLPMLDAPSVSWNFVGEGQFETYGDGTAHVWGIIANSVDPTLQFELEMWLENGMNWQQWSAMGRMYKNDLGYAGNNYLDWSYYELVAGFSRLTGIGSLEGSALELHHQPADYFYGFQSGVGANNKNGNNGVSGWFTYEGNYDGEEVEGHGDLNADMECEEIPDGCGTTAFTKICRAEDSCGNVAFNSQTVAVSDIVAPVINDYESTITIQCAELDGIFITASDACSSYIITYVDQVIVSGCPGQVIRTYTVTDACGNSSTAVQTINLLSEGELEFTEFPEDTEVECDELEDLDPVIEWNAVCSNTQLSVSENIIPGDCPSSYVIEYLYTLTDACDNEVSQVWTVSVFDNTPPQFFDVPENTTISCGDDIPQALPFAVDNCSEVNITLEAITVQEDCGYNFIRTWTAEDACGNTSSASQTIYVSDDQDPFFTFLPPSVTVDCGEPFELDMATVEDQCSYLELEWVDVPLGDCAGSYLRLWRAFDGCGNQALESTTVTIIDNDAPVMTSFPEDITASCGEIPTVESANIEYTDYCGAVDVEFEEVVTDGDCASGYMVVRTWTLTDNCGNSSTYTWEISISDNEAPQLIGVPENTSATCGEEVSEAVVTAIDNCDDDVLVTLSAVTELNECGSVFTRTWTATDNCGNSTSASQVITISDDVAPVFTFVPPSVNISCDGGSTGTLEPATATDDCSSVTITFEDEISSGGCAGGFVRTWIATDGCGNFVEATQEIISNDQESPVITSFPDDLTTSCDNIPTAESANVEYSDDCGNIVTAFEEVVVPGNCPNSYTLQRTWTFTDACGNAVSDTWTIFVVDEQAPQVFGVPENTTIGCGEEIDDAVITAIDNCSSPENITISLQAETTQNECGSLFIRVWSVSDECGNTTSVVQEIQIVDNEPPVFTFIPSDIVANCGDDYELLDATATDDCSDVVVTEEITGDGGCLGGLVRVFTATDGCGNTATAEQIISINDETPPFALNPPASILFYDCGEFLEVGPDYVTFDDACTNVTVEFTENMLPTDCAGSYSMVYTWTAYDECQNFDFQSMEVLYTDQTAPFFTAVPGDIDLSCGQEIPQSEISATDDCSEVLITSEEEELGGGCGYVLVRTYTATDACGNSAQHVQYITFSDDSAPVFENLPGDIMLSCTDAIPPADVPVITDECSEADVELNEYIIPGDCPASYTIVREYTASDLCGNSVVHVQHIYVTDDEGPVFDAFEPEITLTCSQSSGVFATATDNCSSLAMTYSDEVLDGTCGGAILRTYVATDACGNETLAEQIINLVDNDAPQFLTFPEDGIMSCSEVPTVDEVVVEYFDNCSAVTLDFNEVITPGDCPNSYLLERTWTISDVCGNENTQTWTITVSDDEAPLILGVPADVTIDCLDEIPTADVVAFDNCTESPVIVLTATQEQIGCDILFTRRWNAEDECGNMSQEIQVITISDFSNPVLSEYPANIELVCGEDVPAAPVITATDNCNDVVDVVFNEQTEGGITCPTIVRSWCATDCVGNEECHTQTITFLDNGGPGVIENNALLHVWQQNAGNAIVRVTPDKSGRWGIDLYDITGRLVLPLYAGEMKGGQPVQFDMAIADLKDSMYVVRFTNGDTSVSQGFAIIR